MHEVPGHECGVAVGEVVVRPTGSWVKVGGPGPGLPDPAGICLRRDRVAEVLQAVEDVHRAVLDAVLVAGDEASPDPAVVGVLSGVVEQAGAGVEPFDDPLGHRTVVAQPDRAGHHQDVRGQHPGKDLRPFVGRNSMLGHVGPHAGGDVMVSRPEDVDLNAVPPHEVGAGIDQTLGVRHLGRRLERAVDEHRPQTIEAPGACVLSHAQPRYSWWETPAKHPRAASTRSRPTNWMGSRQRSRSRASSVRRDLRRAGTWLRAEAFHRHATELSTPDHRGDHDRGRACRRRLQR